MKPFPHKHLLTLEDFSAQDYRTVFETAVELRQKHRDRSPESPLAKKVLAMIFEKRSTRTRASFYSAMVQLGGQVAEYSESVLHVGEGHESQEDTARAIGLYSDGIVMRCFQQQKVEDYAKYSGVPVINGLTDDLHPCQILADLFALYEIVGDLAGFRLAYVGRPNNITNTLLFGCAALGIELSVGYPEKLTRINDRFYDFIRVARAKNAERDVRINVTHNPTEAVKGAQAVYTDTWFNTGENFKDHERSELIHQIKPFQVNPELMGQAAPGAFFMHCLPAERGYEVTDDVIDDPKVSIVWKQAENRLHVQKAVLALLLR